MKTQIRRSVFETNSSSTHSLAFYKKDEWDQFLHGDGVMENFGNDITTRDIVKEKYREEAESMGYNIDDEDEFDEYYAENYGSLYTCERLCRRYDVIAKEVPDSDYVAVSIEGYD